MSEDECRINFVLRPNNTVTIYLNVNVDDTSATYRTIQPFEFSQPLNPTIANANAPSGSYTYDMTKWFPATVHDKSQGLLDAILSGSTLHLSRTVEHPDLSHIGTFVFRNSRRVDIWLVNCQQASFMPGTWNG